MITFGAWVTQALAANGVEIVFGIPGVHTVELYRGLPASGIRHITPRHEQGAGFMADGYARACGRPGVCFVITGPGLTNIATAMGQAYGDSIPMLVISTVNPAGAMGSGRGYLHELPDQRQLLAQLSAFSHTVLAIEDFPVALARAFALFASARPRPVHIEIPVDLLSLDASKLGPARPFVVPQGPVAAEAVVAQAAAQCENARKPLIVAGGGAVKAAEAIAELAQRLDAPVLMTANARGVLGPTHPLALPIWPGGETGAAVIRDADLIVAIGTELGPTDFEDMFAPGQAIEALMVRCDIDPQQLMRARLADIPVVSDANDFALRLSAHLSPGRERGGRARAQAARKAQGTGLSAQQQASLRLLEILRDSSDNALIVGDSTQPIYAGCLAYAAAAPARFFSSATGYGTLGYALPAAIGAKLGRGEQVPVFAVVGDGGVQFSLQEMGAANDAAASVVMVVWNNRGYGEIKAYMEHASIVPQGVDIYTPNFRKLAEAYEWGYRLVADPTNLAEAVAAALDEKRSVLIEIDAAAFVATTEI